MQTQHTPNDDALSRVHAAIEAKTGHPVTRGQSLCPAHADSSPSLSVAQGRKGVTLKCHAGCATRDVVAAIGLTMADLFDEPLKKAQGTDDVDLHDFDQWIDWQAEACRSLVGGQEPESFEDYKRRLRAPTPKAAPLVSTSPGKLTATYVYTDEKGNPVIRVLRFEPKNFRQQRFEGGRWVNGLGGARRPLYNLPGLRKANSGSGHTIFVVEGEKDAETLISRDIIATTKLMGADSPWLDEYTQAIEKQHVPVIIVADNDKPGRESAWTIREALQGANHLQQVDIWLPAPGFKDITEQYEAGLTITDCDVWVDAQGEQYEFPYWDGSEPTEEPEPALTGPLSRIVDLEALFSRALPPPSWICEPIIPEGNMVTHLYAPRAEGKSSLSLWIATHLAMGINPFDPTDDQRQPLRVLYIDLEMSEDGLKEYLQRDFGFGLPAIQRMAGNLFYTNGDADLRRLDTPAGGSALVELVQAVGPDLVIVDSIGRAVVGEENSNDTFNELFRNSISRLRLELKVPSVWMGNTGKERGKGSRGGSAKEDIMDFVWSLEREDVGRIKLTKTKGRMNWVPEKVILHRAQDADGHYQYQLDQEDGGGVTYMPGSRELAEKLFSMGMLPSAPGTSVRAARKLLTDAGLHHYPVRLIEDAVRYLKTEAMGDQELSEQQP